MFDVPSAVALLISIVIAALLAGPLAKPLRAHATLFYLGAAVVVAVFVGLTWAGVDLRSWHALTYVLQKGYLSSVLLGIVMFTGCLKASSKLRHHLRSVRGELSVLSFICILGHLAVFLPAYLGRLVSGAVLKGNVRASIIIAIVLAIIFLVLGITSFRSVRKLMSPRAWKNLQRFSYLMVALYFVHVLFVLGGSAFGGSHRGLASLVLYALFVALYAILRIRRAVLDRRASKVAVA